MGRGPINENTNVYFKARKRAAMYNERLYSREGAAELLGISVSKMCIRDRPNVFQILTSVTSDILNLRHLLNPLGFLKSAGRQLQQETV